MEFLQRITHEHQPLEKLRASGIVYDLLSLSLLLIILGSWENTSVCHIQNDLSNVFLECNRVSACLFEISVTEK